VIVVALLTLPLVSQAVAVFVTKTVSSTAVAITTESHYTVLSCTVTGAPVMYRYDGTDPTDTVGQPLFTNGTLPLTGGENIRRLRMIRSTSTDATVTCHLE
jgi:hypothetical protein